MAGNINCIIVWKKCLFLYSLNVILVNSIKQRVSAYIFIGLGSLYLNKSLRVAWMSILLIIFTITWNRSIFSALYGITVFHTLEELDALTRTLKFYVLTEYLRLESLTLLIVFFVHNRWGLSMLAIGSMLQYIVFSFNEEIKGYLSIKQVCLKFNKQVHRREYESFAKNENLAYSFCLVLDFKLLPLICSRIPVEYKIAYLISEIFSSGWSIFATMIAIFLVFSANFGHPLLIATLLSRKLVSLKDSHYSLMHVGSMKILLIYLFKYT